MFIPKVNDYNNSRSHLPSVYCIRHCAEFHKHSLNYHIIPRWFYLGKWSWSKNTAGRKEAQIIDWCWFRHPYLSGKVIPWWKVSSDKNATSISYLCVVSILVSSLLSKGVESWGHADSQSLGQCLQSLWSRIQFHGDLNKALGKHREEHGNLLLKLWRRDWQLNFTG